MVVSSNPARPTRGPVGVMKPHSHFMHKLISAADVESII